MACNILLTLNKKSQSIFYLTIFHDSWTEKYKNRVTVVKKLSDFIKWSGCLFPK